MNPRYSVMLCEEPGRAEIIGRILQVAQKESFLNGGTYTVLTDDNPDAIRRMIGNSIVVLAQSEGESVGAVSVAPLESELFPEQTAGSIQYCAVLPAHQRKGCGATLLREAESLADQAGMTVLSVVLSCKQLDLLRFFGKQGYFPASVSGTGHCSVTMAKQLPGYRGDALEIHLLQRFAALQNNQSEASGDVQEQLNELSSLQSDYDLLKKDYAAAVRKLDKIYSSKAWKLVSTFWKLREKR